MKKLITMLCILALVAGVLGVMVSAEAYVAKIGGTGYTNLNDAIAAASDEVIVLQADVSAAVNVPAGKAVVMDLNGHDLSAVSVADDGALYVKDSATDDYAGADCGKITGAVTGNVYGLQESESVFYVEVENKGLSFHRLQLQIEQVVLSSDTAGLSYITTFRGDEAVAGMVENFGVAVSVVDAPEVEQDGKLSTHCEYTVLTGFAAGAGGNQGRSSKVVDILKENNGYLGNIANAEMVVFGKPYAKLKDGTYLLGMTEEYSLKRVAELANTEENWNAQTDAAKAAMGELYETFSYIMKEWDVEKLQAQVAVNKQAAEDRVVKILTLGHSLALDSGHLLALIADAQGLPEGVDELVVGTLYYSGCELWRHVQYLTNNSAEYDLYISSTKTAQSIPVSTKDITMSYALSYDYWDYIIMQGGVFEIAKDETYTDGNIETIQQYVREHVQNPDVKFAWHMQWAPPTDDTLRATYPYASNPYITTYAKYNDDRLTLYNAIAGSVERQLLNNETFEFIIPSGTAMQNAWSSSFTEKELHRDYVHASEYGRAISSYTWYCCLFGIDQLDEIKLDEIPKQFFHASRPVRTEPELTQLEKDVLLESVNNALKTPFAMTQSQYK